MLTKNFVGALKPEIEYKVIRNEKPSSKFEVIRIVINIEEILEDDDSSMMTREVALHVVVRSTISNLASSYTMTTADVDLQHKLKSIT